MRDDETNETPSEKVLTKYQPPRLIEYGSVAGLTRGAFTSRMDSDCFGASTKGC